jgi:hypothetical protein
MISRSLRERRGRHFGAVRLVAQTARLGIPRLQLDACALNSKLHNEDCKRRNEAKGNGRKQPRGQRERGHLKVALLLCIHDVSHCLQLGERADL